VLLDGMGTLLALSAPAPRLVAELGSRGLELALEDAERAFAAEIAYYRLHHLQGRDAHSLTDLRTRCAEVLRHSLPPALGRALGAQELTATMLQCLRFEVYPDVPRALVALRERGLRLLVLSNWDISLHQVLRHTQIGELLDGILTSAEVGQPKPTSTIFQAALELAGVSAEQATHVGDSLELDVVGAQRAGIAPVWLRRPSSALQAPLDDPGFPFITSLDQLPALLT
jgi:putative hydrolase of the HAD superfamily